MQNVINLNKFVIVYLLYLFSDSEMNNVVPIVCIDLFLSNIFSGVEVVGVSIVPSGICGFCEMVFMTISQLTVILISKR